MGRGWAERFPRLGWEEGSGLVGWGTSDNRGLWDSLSSVQPTVQRELKAPQGCRE